VQTASPYAYIPYGWVLQGLSLFCLLHDLNQNFMQTIGINSKGSFVPDAKIVLQRTGAGMKIEKPLKPTRPFSW